MLRRTIKQNQIKQDHGEGRGMWGKLFGRDEERPADPYALPVSRKEKRNGVYALRALGDTRVLAMVEAARAGHWEELKTASAPFDLGRDHQVLGELADIAGVEYWIGGVARRTRSTGPRPC